MKTLKISKVLLFLMTKTVLDEYHKIVYVLFQNPGMFPDKGRVHVTFIT